MVAACFTSTPALGAPGSAQLSTTSDKSGYGRYGGRGKAAYCGRGGANKDPFVVAVETTAEGRPRRVLRHLVERDDSAAIETMAREHFVAGTHVVSDGLGCFRAVTRAGATHTPIVSARAAEQSEKIPALKWVNTILGNLKTAIAGTHKAIRRAYVGRYFAEFQFRFNGRHDLPGVFTSLLAAATSARPRAHRDIRLA